MKTWKLPIEITRFVEVDISSSVMSLGSLRFHCSASRDSVKERWIIDVKVPLYRI